MIKIVVFGNQQIAIECIKIIKNTRNVDLVSVVGCEKSADFKYGYKSLKKYCSKSLIPYYSSPLLDFKFFEQFKRWKPDLCFSIYYRNIIKNKYLRIPPMGFINIHPSLLPRYRGPVPTLWAMLNNEKIIGNTIHYIDSGIDTGDIIAQAKYKIPKNITGFELHNQMMDRGVKLFKEQFTKILNGTNKRIKQDHRMASYYGLFSDDLRKIDWHMPITKIQSKILALTKPYNGAFTCFGNKKMIIWQSKKIYSLKRNLNGPGKIVKVYPDHSFIVTGIDGYLLILNWEFFDANERNVDKFMAGDKKFRFN